MIDMGIQMELGLYSDLVKTQMRNWDFLGSMEKLGSIMELGSVKKLGTIMELGRSQMWNWDL